MTRPAMLNQKLVVSATWAFQYFYYTDHANATMHTAPVRFSPITFRLAEALAEYYVEDDTKLNEVLGDVGKYREDPGR